MSATHTVQIGGISANILSEIETNTKALRVTPKPADWRGGGGVFAASASISIIDPSAGATTLSAAGFWAHKNSSSNLVHRIKKVLVSEGAANAATAGVHTYQLFRGSFVSQYGLVSPVSGVNKNAVTSNTDQSVLRSTMSPVLASYRSSQFIAGGGSAIFLGDDDITATLLGDTSPASTTASGFNAASVIIHLDANPISSISVSKTAVAGSQLNAYSPGKQMPLTIWDTTEGDMAIELMAGEGVVLQVTTPAFGASDGVKIGLTAIWEAIPINAIAA